MAEPGLEALVDQILAYTKVNLDPKIPQPGEVMTFETVPGILPAMPTDITGSITGGLTGPLTVVINSIVKPIKFTVRYKIVVDGKTVSSPAISPLTGGTLPDSDPLMGLLRLPPPLVPEHKATAVVKGTFTATITVDIEGFAKSKDISVPIQLVPVPVPCLLVLQADPQDPDWPSNKTFIMTRLGTQLASAGQAVAALNNVVQVVNGVGDLLGFSATVIGLIADGFEDTIKMITRTGFVIAGIANEEAPDLDDYNDFDDEARSSLLIGPVGTKVQFFSGEEYNGLALGENEVSTFEITEDFGAAAGVTTGFGIHRVPNWRQRMWDTDSGDDMNDCESCKFVS